MITRIQVRGFKSLLDIDVEFGPLTVFVGANGSGKTSVLEAIEFLKDAVSCRIKGEDETDDFIEDQKLMFPRVLSRQGPDAIEIVVSSESDGSTLVHTGKFMPESFECFYGNANSDELPSLDTVGMYRLDAEAMAEATYSDETDPQLEFDGENLAAVLDALQGEARDRFDMIEHKLRGFIPSLRRLRIKRARTVFEPKNDSSESSRRLSRRPRAEPTSVIGHQVAFDFEHAEDISADEASEGTLLLLGLLTLVEVHDPGEEITIMLDDLDRALHPSAQRKLVGYLHGLIKSRPGLQIIATTHSPYLVEHLEFEEVRAITQAPDGSSIVASLTDHPEAERWREEMSAGEFWSSVGEGWVATERSGA